MKQIKSSNGLKIQNFSDEVLNELQGVKVESVFSCRPSFSHRNKIREYSIDTELYILFENGKCLVIEYPFIDALSVEFRSLSSEEMNLIENSIVDDFFNDTTEIYNNNKELKRVINISLEYDCIKKIKLEYVAKPYEKWVGSDIELVNPNPTTFEKITFVMKNKKTFVVCPESAETDGYTLVCSKDAIENYVFGNLKEIDCNNENVQKNSGLKSLKKTLIYRLIMAIPNRRKAKKAKEKETKERADASIESYRNAQKISRQNLLNNNLRKAGLDNSAFSIIKNTLKQKIAKKHSY